MAMKVDSVSNLPQSETSSESTFENSDRPDRPTARHPIGVVARRTGLKPDLIRAWERRYSAVEPSRSSTRRRFYTDEDIERLRLLRDATREGRAISQVANLSDQELRGLIAEDRAETAAPSPAPGSAAGPAPGARPAVGETAASEAADRILQASLAAVRRLDPHELERQLERGSVALSRFHLLQSVLVPLLHGIGDLWQEGTLRPAHEHMASSVVRSFVGNMHGAHHTREGAPHLVVTTPARQHHELGALIVAATAASEGWNVTYLGPDLPAEEIAAAVQQKGALAVALSVTYPPDDPILADELRRLRRLLGPGVTVFVGGRCAEAYGGVLEEIEASHGLEIQELRQHLERLRSGPARRPSD